MPFMEVPRKPGVMMPGMPLTSTVQITETSGSSATRNAPTTRQVASLSLALRAPSTAPLQDTRPTVKRIAETTPQLRTLKPMRARMAAPSTSATASTTYGAYPGSWPLVNAERLRVTGAVRVISSLPRILCAW